MNPTFLGVIGPGFLSQVPTLSLPILGFGGLAFIRSGVQYEISTGLRGAGFGVGK